MRTLKSALLLLGLFAAQPVGAAMAAPETREPVRVVFTGTSDSDFINAVYGEVLKQYGYRVKYVQSDYAAHYTALETGDIDISLGAWQTVPEMTDKALASGKVVSYGPTGVKVTEGWWYSNSMKAKCPALPNWEALKDADCVKAVVTAETAPKGRFLDAPADWGVGSADFIKDKGLNLDAVNSGSGQALLASAKGALDRNEPYLGWGYEPNWVFSNAKGNFVERPGFHRDYDVLKLGNKEQNAKIPNAIAILKAYQMNAADVAVAMQQVDSGGLTAEGAAQDWMSKHEAVWKAWLPK